jgi:hypothetical protein
MLLHRRSYPFLFHMWCSNSMSQRGAVLRADRPPSSTAVPMTKLKRFSSFSRSGRNLPNRTGDSTARPAHRSGCRPLCRHVWRQTGIQRSDCRLHDGNRGDTPPAAAAECHRQLHQDRPAAAGPDRARDRHVSWEVELSKRQVWDWLSDPFWRV